MPKLTLKNLHDAKKYLQKSLSYDMENKTIAKEIDKVENDILRAKDADECEIKKLTQKIEGPLKYGNDYVPKVEDINEYICYLEP